MKKAVLLITIILSFLLYPSISWTEENFSPVEGSNKIYKVKSSDSLYSIARKFDVSMEHIALANGMTSYYVRTGQKLVIPLERVLPGTLENGVILNLPERAIYFFKKGNLKAVFPCAVGAPGRWMTPRGDFYIASRIMNPIWLPPEWAGIEHPVFPGPSHPLGDRWMGLSQPGVGMHATNAPASIGGAVSHGCIRMYPEDAHTLFGLVTVGLPVKIIYEPVKVGFSMKTKKFYLSVFPDIYYLGTNNFKEVMKKLKSLEIDGFVNEKQIKRIISEARGIPQEILGSDVVIKVDGNEAELTQTPFIKGGLILACSHIFKSAGAELFWDSSDKSLTIVRENMHLKLKPGKKEALLDGRAWEMPVEPVLFRGQVVVPVKSVAQAIGLNVQWVEEEKTLSIDTGKNSLTTY